jgi:hypothetical protein
MPPANALWLHSIGPTREPRRCMIAHLVRLRLPVGLVRSALGGRAGPNIIPCLSGRWRLHRLVRSLDRCWVSAQREARTAGLAPPPIRVLSRGSREHGSVHGSGSISACQLLSCNPWRPTPEWGRSLEESFCCALGTTRIHPSTYRAGTEKTRKGLLPLLSFGQISSRGASKHGFSQSRYRGTDPPG